MSTPTPSNKRAMRQLSVQEKVSAVQRVHDGESKASVARLIGVPESTLRGWCKNEMKLRTMTDRGPVSPSPSPPLPPESAKRPRSTLEAGEVDDALWFWLRNQQQQQRHNEPPPPVKTVNNNHHHSSWFWKWYKEFGVGVPEPHIPMTLGLSTPVTASPAPSLARPLSPEEPLPLVVRRNKDTKELPLPVLVDSNCKENTTALSEEDEDEPPATAADALKHGEKFLRWLECCSDPTVTAVQLLQFRYLLNNVKNCAQRRAAGKIRSTRSRRK